MKIAQVVILFLSICLFLFFAGTSMLGIGNVAAASLPTSSATVLLTLTPSAPLGTMTATPVAMQDLLVSLQKDGYINQTDGIYQQLGDYDQNGAQVERLYWNETGSAPRNFVVRANANWESACPNADWSVTGPGFIFHDQDKKRFYAAFLRLSGYVEIVRMDLASGKVYPLVSKRYGKLDLVKGQAKLMLIVNENVLNVFVNDKFVLKYQDKLMTSKDYGSGKLKYALDSGCQKGFGIHTTLTNVELWEFGNPAQLSITQTAIATTIPQMDENTRLGIQAYQNGNYQEAIDAITKAINLKTQYALIDGYIYRGRAFYSMENYEQALSDFTKAMSLDAEVEKAYLYRGYVYTKQKQPVLALSDYNQAIKLDPYDIWAYRSRALIYISQKNYDKALADYNKSISIDSEYATAYNNRCYVLAQLKRYQNALTDCDKALQLEPDNAEFLDTRALVYKGLGRVKSAIADLEKILQISKDAALIESTNAMLETLKK